MREYLLALKPKRLTKSTEASRNESSCFTSHLGRTTKNFVKYNVTLDSPDRIGDLARRLGGKGNEIDLILDTDGVFCTTLHRDK